MDSYIIGPMIKKLREKKCVTQNKLAEELMVSVKTISKWETGRGLPDISVLEALAKALDVSLIELFNGEVINNYNRSSNMLKTNFYVCPICGNVIASIGEGVYSCCGNRLIKQESDEDENIQIENGDELYITIESKMVKNDYVSFIAYLTSDRLQINKLYPEQACETHFTKCGHGYIYYYDIRNGLFRKRI